MKKSLKLQVLSAVAMAGLGGAALADGFSATLDVPVNPFSARLGLNYALEVVPQLFVGARVGVTGAPVAGSFSVGFDGRLGAKYIGRLVESRMLNADWYGGAGANFSYVGGGTFVGNPDVNAGVKAVYALNRDTKVYGGVDGDVVLNTVTGGFVPGIGAYAGLKLEPINNLEAYLQGGVGFNSLRQVEAAGNGFLFDTRVGVYYAFAPQFKLGATAGFDGGLRFGISAQFAEKPGTLATPGNYLP